MKRFSRPLALPCLAAALLAGNAALADVTANVDVTSNYIFRGQSISADHAAVQGGLDYSHGSGFYAGTWLSTIDADKSNTNTGTEYDLYAGVSNELVGPVSYDLAYLRYNYTEHVFPIGTDVKVGLKYGPGTFNYYIGDTGARTDHTYGYYELGLKFELIADVGLQLHYGITSGDYPKAAFEDDNVTDYSVALSKEIGGFKLTAAYAEHEHDDPKPFVMLYKEFAL